MADPRDREYAELIVDGCLGVQPGWQVLVGGNPLARPLLEEVCGAVARRGAYALLRVSFEGFLAQSLSWVADAPLELISQPAALVSHEIETVDALLFVSAPDNTRAAAGIESERMGALQAAYRPGHLAHDEPRRALGGLPVSDGCARPGGRSRQRGLRRPALRCRAARLGRRGRAHALDRGPLRRCLPGSHRGRRHRSPALARGALDEGRRAGREPSRRRVLRVPGRGLGRGRDLVRRLPGPLSRPRGHGDPAPVRGRPSRRRLGRLERGVPDRDARHRRGCPPSRRARDRLQSRHHALHEEHALRREDGRDGAPRARQQLHGPRRRERVGHPLGPRQGPAARRARGSSSTAPSSSRTVPGRSDGFRESACSLLGRRRGRLSACASRRLEPRSRSTVRDQAAGGGGGPGGPGGAGRGGTSWSMCCHRFSSIRFTGQLFAEPPKSSDPAEKTRAPASVS